MKNNFLIALTLIISLSLYSCGNQEDEPTPQYNNLWGEYIYTVSGEITMTIENEQPIAMNIRQIVPHDGIIFEQDNKDTELMWYTVDGEKTNSVQYVLNNNKITFTPETVASTTDGVSTILTLNHGIATISNDNRTITWTTNVSGYTTKDGVSATISGSYTNKAVKE